MNFWQLLLRMFGWKTDISLPYRPKCVICVAPHTSNWDFILGYAAWHSLGRNACFLMKEAWFFFPLKYLLRAMGGIPVPKKRGANLSKQLEAEFASSTSLNLAVTPEGTRSPRAEWRKGFLFIATEAKVPVQLGIIDYQNKTVRVTDEMTPSGNIEADLRRIKEYYKDKGCMARYPDKFLV